jgi:hypothetical protein
MLLHGLTQPTDQSGIPGGTRSQNDHRDPSAPHRLGQLAIKEE